MNRKKLIIILVAVLTFTMVVIATVVTVVVTINKSTPVEQSVETACGRVTGKISKTKSGSDIYEFFNVPYATPPLGNLRFEAPKVRNKFDPWNGPVNATEDKSIICVQAGVAGAEVLETEDCLVLTIRSMDLEGAKPVVVWIHGGGLEVGSCCTPGYSFDANTTELLDAVTVNINYRLGFLGFSTIEELWDVKEGVRDANTNTNSNNGIRDMAAALEWVQDNIASFGGDPGRVTVVGHSGGATATLALVSSPLTKNSMHRVVALAPAPEMRTGYLEGGIFQKAVTNVLTATGCDRSDDTKECLKAVDAKWLTPYYENANPSGKLRGDFKSAYFDFPMQKTKEGEKVGWIVIDDFVITQAPRDLPTAKYVPNSKVKVIIENTVHENAIETLLFKVNVFTDQTELDKTLRDLFPAVTNANIDDVMEKMDNLYDKLSPQLYWDTLTTDMRSTCPTNDVAEAMAQSNHHEIYRLFITFGLDPEFQVFHIWEVLALFGYRFQGIGLEYLVPENSKGWEFRNVLIAMLKNFVNDGSVETGWEPFPGKSMTIDNTEDMKSITTEKPHQTNCEELANLDLVKYGWQN